MSEIYRARVLGPAGTQGSKRVVTNKSTGNAMMIEASKDSRSWRVDMRDSMRADAPPSPFNEAVMMHVRVYMSRPMGHYRTDGRLKPRAPRYPPNKNKDVDKVQRSVGDAAKIAKWVMDDGLISWHAVRLYTADIAEPERVEVSMYSMEAYGEYLIEQIAARLGEPPWIVGTDVQPPDAPPRIRLQSGIYQEVVQPVLQERPMASLWSMMADPGDDIIDKLLDE